MNKVRKRIGLLGLGLCGLPTTSAYTRRLDFGLYFTGSELGWIPTIGVGYDVRNPASRDGWSCVPNMAAFVAFPGRNVQVYGFPGALARWRYAWTPSFYMDIDLGASVMFIIDKKGLDGPSVIHPMSVNVGYRFKNDMLLGLKLGCLVFYSWQTFSLVNLLPIVGVTFSMPIKRDN